MAAAAAAGETSGELSSIELDFYSSQTKSCSMAEAKQFWDPVVGQCYNLSCGYLYENRLGTCSFKNITRQNLLCTHKSELKWWEVRYIKNRIMELSNELRMSVRLSPQGNCQRINLAQKVPYAL